jgi:hypothetical protein
MDPYFEEWEFDRQELIIEFLVFEYGEAIIEFLLTDTIFRGRLKRYRDKIAESEELFEADNNFWTQIENQWPQTPNLQTNLACMRNYFVKSRWRYGLPCAVCSRKGNQEDFKVTEISPLSSDSILSLSKLELLRCNIDSMKSHFIFPRSLKVFNGLMLNGKGMSDGPLLSVCAGCLKSLSIGHLPKYALKNDLYRGELPEEFRDLTWIEEMVCCVYRTTAHVVRLFNSSDERQPKVFHGNVCAHEMNIVDTARVLPRTPEDINGAVTLNIKLLTLGCSHVNCTVNPRLQPSVG